MKRIQQAVLICFTLILLVPLALFNFQEPALSEIDNRMLAPNPLSASGDLTQRIDDYVSDRIGLRDEMILSYTVLNDRLFGKMSHPTYVYGQEGYVFSSGIWIWEEFSDYHRSFIRAVREIQDYCESRGIPFLLVFDPAKPAVLPEYLEPGVSYDRSWVEEFLSGLEEAGVQYLDNTPKLRQLWESGEQVFNQKYDANHWNALGAYYGTRYTAELLRERIPTVHVVQPEELTISQKLETTLPVSRFPINEYVPSIQVSGSVEDLTASYSQELLLHPQHRAFGYFRNPELAAQGAPRALVFQGSYMNAYGCPYFQNSFGEYIYVHDYENVLDLPYYFNIFQPDCVVFEVAEYTISQTYFDQALMDALELNPPLELSAPGLLEFGAEALQVTQGETLTTLTWAPAEPLCYAWLVMDHTYDFLPREDGLSLTLKTADYLQYRDSIRLYAIGRDQ